MWAPELYDFLVGAPVTLPTVQIIVLTACWFSSGMALSSSGNQFDPFDIKKTRGVDPLAAATAALAPWVATFLFASVFLAVLDAAFQLGPGLSQEEVDFLVGTYVVVGGWRVVASSLLPPI